MGSIIKSSNLFFLLVLLIGGSGVAVAMELSNSSSVLTSASSKGSKWTTYGDIQAGNPDITAQYKLGNGVAQVRTSILTHPISNEAVLPYSRTISGASAGDTIDFTTTAGEYEPASIVIQSGNKQLNDVVVTISDLVVESGKGDISSTNIDIRLVKAWFQSNDQMRRTDRSKQKQLLPELLLHDNELVQVDYNNQLNLVRKHPALKDASALRPFSIEPNFNQQIWITVKTPDSTMPGNYKGVLTVSAMYDGGEEFRKTISINGKVLPFKLENTKLLMGKFYLARLVKNNKKTYFNARGKNDVQMTAELNDMKRHGVNLMTVDHGYDKSGGELKNRATLSKQVKLIKQAGFTDNPIVYVDWKVGWYDDEKRYLKKMSAVKESFNSVGVDDFWIYNRDEKKLSILRSELHTFEAAHTIGSKNIVAITKPGSAKKLKGYLDLVLIQHRTSTKTINELRQSGIIPLAYGMPHAGEEKPESTRETYGFGLVKKGFSGAISYAYQSGECWDDWMQWKKSNYRPNVMAYPTAEEPIPTLQWEAWREAVDDLRYLATYAKLSGKSPETILQDANKLMISSPRAIRKYLIKKILETS